MLMMYFPCKDGQEPPQLEGFEKQVYLFWQELYLEAEGDGLLRRFSVLKDARDKFRAKDRRIFDRARFILFCPYSLAPDEHKRCLASGHKTVREFFDPSSLKGSRACKKISRQVHDVLQNLSTAYDETVCNRSMPCSPLRAV